jgi:hypothetical protein
MIFTELRLALTVPSLPRPKKTARVTSSVSVVNSGSYSRLKRVTSSTMPTVKCRFGCGLANSAKTAAAWAGVNSFDDRPYRPPITAGGAPGQPSASAVITS